MDRIELSTFPTSLADDILTGIPRIAAFLGKTDRQTRWAAEQGHLPTFRIGKIIHARRSVLLEHIEEQERAAVSGK